MSRKVKKLQRFINISEIVAFAAIAISILLGIVLSGEPTSEEGERIQYICLFSLIVIMLLSFAFIFFLEKILLPRFLKRKELEDYKRRAAKVQASAETKKELQDCLISIGKADPKTLVTIDLGMSKELKNLRDDYFTLS